MGNYTKDDMLSVIDFMRGQHKITTKPEKIFNDWSIFVSNQITKKDKKELSNVKISEHIIKNKSGKELNTVVVFYYHGVLGGWEKDVLNLAMHKYIGNTPCNMFFEESCCYPNVRAIMFGIDKLELVSYADSKTIKSFSNSDISIFHDTDYDREKEYQEMTLDNIVKQYKQKNYYEFIETNYQYPNFRLLISELSELKYEASIDIIQRQINKRTKKHV